MTTTSHSDDLFIGRSQETRRMLELWTSIKASKQPNFLFVQGESGIGKTTLINHFINKVKMSHDNPIICSAQCLMNETEGYAPFRDIFFSLYDQGMGIGLTKKQIFEFVLEEAAAWGKIIASDPKFLVAEKLAQGAKNFHAYVNQKNLVFSQNSIAEQFYRFISRILQKRKLIIFIDDLQWCDPSSLSLLPVLQLHFQSGELLFIGAHRPKSRLDTRDQELFSATISRCIQQGAPKPIDLHEGISVKSYVEKHFPHLSLSPAMINRIQTRTDGHPFFVDRLFASWITHNFLVPQEGADKIIHWKLARAEEDIELPMELTELIKEQLALMAQELRNLLEVASVEGEDFTLEVLSRISSVEIFQTMNRLDDLEKQHRMVKPIGNEAIGSVVFGFYGFWHAFVQEYLYNKELNDVKRRQIHLMVGQTLEALYQDADVRPISAQLARHFREAMLNIKAAKYCLMAAEHEQSRFAWEASEKWCEDGIDLAKGLKGEEAGNILIELLKFSTKNHNTTGNYEKAIERMRLAVETAFQINTTNEERALLCQMLADYLEFSGEIEEGREVLLRGKNILGKQNSVTLLGLMLDTTWAQLLRHEDGKSNEALNLYVRVISQAEKLPQTDDVKELLFQVYNTLGLSLLILDRFQEGHQALRKSHKIALELGNHRASLASMLNLAYSLTDSGKFDESFELTEKALKIAHQVASLDDEAYAYTVQGACFVQMGEYARAIELQKKSLQIHSRLNSTWNYMFIYYDMAAAYIGLGDLEAAEEAAKLSQENADDDNYEKSYSLEAMARVQAEKGEWSAAETNFLTLIKAYTDNGSRWTAARAKKFYGMMLAQKGDIPKARKILETSLQEMESLNSPFEIQLIRKALDELPHSLQ